MDRVVVATDDERVIDAVHGLEVDACLTGPAATGTDRVGQVARRPEYRQVRWWVNIQGDEPFLPASSVRGALELIESGAVRLATAATPLGAGDLENPHVTKVWVDGACTALGFGRSPSRSIVASRAIFRHVGVYAYTAEALARWCDTEQTTDELRERLEQLRPFAYAERIGVAVIDQPAPHGIDTAADLAAANALLTQCTGTSERVSP